MDERNATNPHTVTNSKPYTTLAALSDDLIGIVTAVAPRIVTIDAGGRRLATGTVWRDGIVVTTAHAMRDPEHLRVTTDKGETLDASFGGWDLGSDLAVLKIEGLTHAELATDESGSQREVSVGQLAVVLAGGREQPAARLTMIAGVGRVERLRRGARLGHVIELDLAPFSGYSGGPLVDSGGRLIGINTAGLIRGAALALPVDFVAKTIDELLTHGRVARGYLGVGMQPVRVTKEGQSSEPDRPRETGGLLIHALESDGPAEKAGILVGDILVNIDGASLNTPARLLEALGSRKVGDSIRLGVRRGGHDTEITMAVGERPQRTAARRCHGR